MNNYLEDYISNQNMSHPDFPDMGLGDVVYIRKSFYKNRFVYTLNAANGEILLQNEDWDTVQEFAIEYDLELITLH